ncbi:MAG TPA: sigma-70 family RNA polymerase sigma factor [Phycisphaerae bacterium]|nr:sigma-70 family RNA polymerase sigma factor [Phycisphaerae bacterium]
MPATTDARPSFVNESAQRRINYRLGRLARRYQLGPQDRQDLRQDLWLALLRASRRFDPARCPIERFVGMVLNRHCKHHVRQFAQARTNRPQQVAWDHRMEAVLLDPQAEADLRHVDLRHDVQALLAQLPRPQRRLCKALMHRPPYQAARHLGISASTLYRQIRRLRPRFAEAGLDGILRD